MEIELCSTALNCPVADNCRRNDKHYRKDVLDSVARVYRANVWTPATGCQNYLQLQRKESHHLED